ncbi:hypothetical protein [Halocynthiibacter sp.]|uniref:hypothetical protein n=1 Tax=Halocynthiibacter sp. TaxID=1979210 RepID=UPI003C5438EB
MVVFRRAVAAVVCLIFANRLSHLTGSSVIAPGDPGYEFGAITSSLLTYALLFDRIVVLAGCRGHRDLCLLGV